MDKVLTNCFFWALILCPMLEGGVHFCLRALMYKPSQKVDTSQEAHTLPFFVFFERRFSTRYIRHLDKAILDYKSAFVTVSEIKPTNFHHYSQLTMHSLVVLHSLKVMQSNR
jgi:hypothetical protein